MNPAANLLSLVSLLAASAAFGNASDIEGTWITGNGDGLIEIVRVDSGISGVIAGSPIEDPDRSDVDEKNPDENLRNRPLIGLQIFNSFRYNGKNRWSGGTIYDPDSGKTYRCTVTQVDRNTLKVRGFIGMALFGRTEIWRREAD